MPNTSSAPSPILKRLSAIWAPLTLGLMVWLALPERVVAIDDDFGYLRSLQETWERGRLWTHGFLVPFAATTTALVGAVFAFTGSMAAAVHSHLALCSGVACAAGVALLRRAGVSASAAGLMLLILLTAPSVMFMQVMFTSVSLYWACLWACAWAACSQRWSVFILAFFLAIGTRQSALLWLALPGWVVVQELWRVGGRGSQLDWSRVRGPLLAGLLGFAFFMTFKLGMNETNAQRHYAKIMATLPGAGPFAWVGPAFLLCGCGWAGCLLGRVRREVPSPTRAAVGLVLAVLAGLLAIQAYSLLNVSHHMMRDPWARPMLALSGAIGGWGLIFIRRVWLPALMAGLCGMVPQWLYVSGFDYYYLESFFWGFIAIAVGMAVARYPHVGPKPPIHSTALTALAVILLLSWHGRCWVRHKLMQDYVSAYCEIYELATREGLLARDEIGTAPFGYVGWRLEPNYTANGGTDPGAFNQLLQDWDGKEGIGVVADYPKPVKYFREWLPTKTNASLRSLPPSTIIKELRAPILWFYTARFQLKKVAVTQPRPQPEPMDPSRSQYHPFPLNDEEWRQVMKKSPLSLSSANPPPQASTAR